jgi:hypothetical protein
MKKKKEEPKKATKNVDEIQGKSDKPVESKDLPRAERRRLLKDPTYNLKMMSVNPGISEYGRLIAYGQLLLFEMNVLKERIEGLYRTPKESREERGNKLIEDWNLHAQKIQEVQERMAEIEKEEEAKKAETPTT